MGASWRACKKLPKIEWEKYHYSPRRRSIAYLVSEALVKQNKIVPVGDSTEDVEEKTALIVDDVFLTGATLRTATSLLLARGAAAVDVVTLTRSGGILWADAVAENKQLYEEFSANDHDDAYLSDGIYVTAGGRLVDRG